MRKVFFWIVAAAAAACAAPVLAQPTAAPHEIVEILPLAFTREGLSGVGGERLRAQLADAQFIALGEDHGFAGSAHFAAALAHDAESQLAATGRGPLYHVAEIGPNSARWVREQLATGGIAGLGEAFRRRPFAIPFVSNAEDAVLAAPFAAADRLWGIDQEFLGAPSILLDWLIARSDDPATRALLADWRDRDAAALASGQYSDIMTSKATPADFAVLRARFADDADAQATIDDLAASAHIYQLNDQGRYLLNNEVRAALMERYFLAAYRAAPTRMPHVLLKMGANHVGRGTTRTSIIDIGSLLPGLAAANGRTSLHLAYLPLAGNVRSFKPSQGRLTAVGPYADETVAPILAAAGIEIDRIPAEGHVVIPLAPLRHNLAGKKLRELPAFSRFLLLGFDYLVTTRNAQPATHFEARDD